MARTLIHIGMPRNGSTLLQQQVFPRIVGFKYHGLERTHYSAAFQQMMYQDDSLFDADAFKRASHDLSSSNAILSNELFVGQSLYVNATNRSRNFARLAAAFPEGEAVLVLRNQEALLRSLYCLGVYAGHVERPERFVQFVEARSGKRSAKDERIEELTAHAYATFSPSEQVENYRYTPIMSALHAHFRKVHVFLFEDFQSEPQTFINDFAERLQIEIQGRPAFDTKVNRSLNARQISLLRKLNPWKPLMDKSKIGRALFRRKLQFIERHAGGERPFKFSPAMEERLKQYFHADNEQLLSNLPQLDLKGNFSKHYLS
jgi:hypothetical protein